MTVSTPAVPDLLGTCPADLLPDIAVPQSTYEEARERADRIRAGLADYTRMREDIAAAKARRDWLSLGHGTWFAYVEAEYGAPLRRLARDDRREAVQDLRADGMSLRQIGATVGVSQEQVRRDLAQVSPDVTPVEITGADGKRYPATRPASTKDTTDVPAGRGPVDPEGSSAIATTDRPGATDSDRGFPLVLVSQAPRPLPPARAELREEHPTRPGIVKVVYEASRTGAWIDRSRIIEPADPLAGVGDQYEPDPANRIAAVAEVAPEYVRPVPESPQEGVVGGGGVKRAAGTAAAPRPVDLAQIDADLHEIRGPARDNPLALRALQVAEALRGEVDRLTGELAALRRQLGEVT